MEPNKIDYRVRIWKIDVNKDGNVDEINLYKDETKSAEQGEKITVSSPSIQGYDFFLSRQGTNVISEDDIKLLEKSTKDILNGVLRSYGATADTKYTPTINEFYCFDFFYVNRLAEYRLRAIEIEISEDTNVIKKAQSYGWKIHYANEGQKKIKEEDCRAEILENIDLTKYLSEYPYYGFIKYDKNPDNNGLIPYKKDANINDYGINKKGEVKIQLKRGEIKYIDFIYVKSVQTHTVKVNHFSITNKSTPFKQETKNNIANNGSVEINLANNGNYSEYVYVYHNLDGGAQQTGTFPMTISNITNDIVVNIYYVPPRKVTVYHIVEDENGIEIPDTKLTNSSTVKFGPEAQKFEPDSNYKSQYEFLENRTSVDPNNAIDVENNLSEVFVKNEQESACTQDVVIKFFYKYKEVPEEPDIDIEPIIEYEGDGLESPKDSPALTELGKKEDDKVIVLDEAFSLRFEFENNSDISGEYEIVDVQMPFDVYANKKYSNDKDKLGEFMIVKQGNKHVKLEGIPEDKKNITIAENERGRSKKMYFRLPSWVLEQSYAGDNAVKITLRNKATNATIDKTVDIFVIGRVYDFTVTNLTGDGPWNQSLFVGERNNNLVGMEYRADTLPIGQHEIKPAWGTKDYGATYLYDNDLASRFGGSESLKTQPLSGTYKYGISLGSTFLFNINTKGLKSSFIKITPKLTYFDMAGNIVSATFSCTDSKGNVIAIPGSSTINTFSTSLSTQARLKQKVIEEQAKARELKTFSPNISGRTGIDSFASIKCAYAEYIEGTNAVVDFGNQGLLKLPTKLRLPFRNYGLAKSEVGLIGRQLTKDANKYLPYTANREDGSYFDANAKNKAGLSLNQVVNSLGHWYAEYTLPRTLVVKDSSGKALTKGYVMVSFKIETLTEKGNTYLSYASSTYNCWNYERAHGNDTYKVPHEVHLPVTNTLYNYQVENDGYFPVAIYDIDVKAVEAAQSH